MAGAKGARGRRFGGALAPEATDVNASIAFDWRLLRHDIAGSIAHARMLVKTGVLSPAEADRIVEGLGAVQEKLERGEQVLEGELEDIHMNVEARLIDAIGEPGRRLHAGRSRNDQVATDLRLYVREAARTLRALLDELDRALLDAAEEHVDTVMPGYTHLQRAQPVRLAHHLLAYCAMLHRDKGRIDDAAVRAGECPLGAGALAATSVPIDRDRVAADLGFPAITRNSLDAVGDRDFAIELVAAIALCQVHLSRLGEEIVLWLSQEFRFARLSEEYCSASSLMPQKVNPDLAELVRGKAGRVIGDWVTLMTVVKGLPLAYNKDLQETQEPLFDAVETLEASLRVAIGMIRNLEFDPVRLREAAETGHLVATEVADYLVAKGVAFRQAHDVAGALVRKAIAAGVELAALPLAAFVAEHPAFDNSVFTWLAVDHAVDRRDVVGGPARRQVLAEIARVRAMLEKP